MRAKKSKRNAGACEQAAQQQAQVEESREHLPEHGQPPEQPEPMQEPAGAPQGAWDCSVELATKPRTLAWALIGVLGGPFAALAATFATKDCNFPKKACKAVLIGTGIWLGLTGLSGIAVAMSIKQVLSLLAL